ncbi:MAG TPA: hypothetical protein DER60_02735 [Syntrophomonas sp.]|jgi:hypothetical protein|nr:hypothetical protein [Syntrophomonas sp.]
MKQKLILVFAILMIGLFATQAIAADIPVLIEGQAVEFVDQKPYIDENNRTLVPMRAPMEALGATVSWDAEQYQATFEKDGIVVVFVIGNNTYTVNGEAKEMDTKAVLTGDRTCIPIRYAAEALGYTVLWNSETSTVDIVASDPEGDQAVPDEGTVDENTGEGTTDENIVDDGAADENSDEGAEDPIADESALE